MADIIKELQTVISSDLIADAVFEGANIVLYTKDIEFFLNDRGLVREAVNHIKKRIELRPDPSVTLDQDKTIKLIKEIVPEDAEIDQIIFDKERSIVIIEMEKPGIVIGRNGTTLHEIRRQTQWVPLIRRTPAIRSKIVEDIRNVLFEQSDYRRKFLNKVGERIYNGWMRGKQSTGWVRMTYLGSGRHVGRSCMLLQTPESRILLDCGVDVGNPDEAYPMLESPDFNLQDLDAVIISHAHLDHIGFLPYLFKFGYRGPVYCNEPTRDIMALSLLDYVKIMSGSGKDPIYTKDDVKEMIKHTICLNYEEVTDITPDVRITFYNSGHILGSAMTHLHIGNGLHNILYTADLKYARTRLLDPAVTRFPRLETLMIEGTYGGKDNVLQRIEDVEEDFARLMKETIEGGGKVLVPVLGVGRAQEVMLMFESFVREGKLPEIPVYIDGMVWDDCNPHCLSRIS
jgi:KH/beta-lactamase-domain protein